MSKEEDVVHDAIERLEWDERKEEDTPFKRMRQVTRRTALTGGAAGIGALILQACGGSSSSSSSSSSSATATGSASAATGGSAAARIFGVQQGLQVHAGQPRHHQPVLHARRRTAPPTPASCWAARTSGPARRTPTSARWSARSTARSAPASTASASRSIDLHAFNSPTDKALAAKIPVVAYNADAAGQRPAGLHRPGPVRLRPGDGPAHRPARPLRRRRAVHRHAGLAEHPAADRWRAAVPQVQARDQDPRRGDRAPPCPRSCRRSTPTPPHTPAPRACSRSTAGAPRASRRSIKKHNLIAR